MRYGFCFMGYLDYFTSKITTRFKYAFSNIGSVPPIATFSSWLGLTPSATKAS